MLNNVCEDLEYANLNAFLDYLESEYVAVSYDDILSETCYSEIQPDKVRLESKFSERVPLRVPIASAAMDTVTEAPMAIALAEFGGIGVIHSTLTPKEQAAAVARVKHRQNGRIQDPITVPDTMRVAELHEMRERKGYFFHRFPVLDSAGSLIGLVTKRDIDRCEDESASVVSIMTPRDGLTVADASISKREAYELMKLRRVESLPLVGANGTLKGLFLFEDLKRIFRGQSTANVDGNDQLRVAAAIGTREQDLERAALLLEERCDVIVIDSAHGHSLGARRMIEAIRHDFPDTEIVAGNVSDPKAALALARWGANGIKVGQGPGSICTTRLVAGVGVPQASAVGNCARALREEGFGHIPLCADGGIRGSGDVAKALWLGASSVMLGSLLAGTDEAPGDRYFDSAGQEVKKYRGMGSHSAMRESQAARERYFQTALPSGKRVAEGIEGTIKYKGPASVVLEGLSGGLRIAMGYLGAEVVAEMPERARPFRITESAKRESGVHDVQPEA